LRKLLADVGEARSLVWLSLPAKPDEFGNVFITEENSLIALVIA